MTETLEEKRRKALKDRTKYDDDILEEVEILDRPELGGGRTNPDSYEIKQFPFPTDSSIRRKRKIDLREDPATGGTR